MVTHTQKGLYVLPRKVVCPASLWEEKKRSPHENSYLLASFPVCSVPKIMLSVCPKETAKLEIFISSKLVLPVNSDAQ